ncbi:MAG: hypothetical protein IKR57_03490 [Bacilli bacterium]|nr:hypothetical protein [Bacilli bacterium]
MKIEFEKPNLIQEYFTLLLSDKVKGNGNNDVSSVTNKIDYYVSKIDTYKLLMNKDRALPNSVFLDLLKEISRIKLEEKDILNILSLKENANYNRILILSTDMIAKRKNTTYVSLKVASTSLLNTKHIYTIDEINNLIEDKTIVVLGEYLKSFNLEKYKTHEKYMKYDYFSNSDFVDKEGRLYVCTLQYIRNTIKDEMLKKELDNYIRLLKIEIDKVTNNKYLINNSSIISKDISEQLDEKQITLKLI